MFMWGAEIICANYLRNRSPCSSINFKTPYELLYDKLLAISHLKIFGCKAYPLIVNRDRYKFESTAQANCIMIGYAESNGIYWIYNKTRRTMFRSRDVKFNEEMCLSKNSISNKDEWIDFDLNMDDQPINNEGKSTEGIGCDPKCPQLHIR